MARCEVKLPSKELDALGSLIGAEDEIADAALKAGANVVEPVMRSNLAAAIGKNTKAPSRSTGQLAAALGTTSVKTDRRGDHNIKVGFAENRDDGRANALVANVLEYGRSNQPACPFLAPTRRKTRKAALQAVKDTLKREIEGHQP